LEFEGGVISGLFNQPGPALERRGKIRQHQNELTEIVMSTSTLIETPAAQDERATLLVGFELGKSSWLIGLYAPELGKTVSRHKIDGGDLGKVLELIAAPAREAGQADPGGVDLRGRI
jgi:hypothetical protein